MKIESVALRATPGKYSCVVRVRAAGRLDLDVDVLGAARILARHDGLQHESPIGVGVLVAAQGVAPVVVGARTVGLPEVEPGARDRLGSRAT